MIEGTMRSSGSLWKRLLVAKGDPTWIPTAITAASTLFAAFLGALAVLLGPRRTSNQALQIAREQRRYERIHEMRAQTIPKMYADLALLMNQLDGSTQNQGDIGDEDVAKARLVVDHLDDVIESARLNTLWFPSEVNDSILALTKGLQDQIARNSISRGNMELGAGSKAFNDWLKTEGAEKQTALASSCREAPISGT